MTTRIAFDYNKLEIRQIIEANGRKRVCSCPAKHLSNFSWVQMWQSWMRYDYMLKSHKNDVLILEKIQIQAQPEPLPEAA